MGLYLLVRETGGLKDTVMTYNQYTKQGIGFSFKPFSSYDFKQVFDLAIILIIIIKMIGIR